ncbi:MAG: transcriptional regulator, AbrB family [Gammaproteobacteria bacterium]|jgi:bifunctional DNA-binding transcriptional regulator/antitoxin component of YhaV-PrlF toxin-antitoxin module|nr:transcriptional regulator, AbrB family [Gammaproteobacteria bacterium]MCE3237158.1 transcriptional regulator, AbrB family [Gammaproteobacteria bacterium]
MRITQKGQVTIPFHIREKYNLRPYKEANFIEEKGRVYLVAAPKKNQRNSTIITQLRGTATIRMSTDEILALTRGKK